MNWRSLFIMLLSLAILLLSSCDRAAGPADQDQAEERDYSDEADSPADQDPAAEDDHPNEPDAFDLPDEDRDTDLGPDSEVPDQADEPDDALDEWPIEDRDHPELEYGCPWDMEDCSVRNDEKTVKWYRA